MVTITSSADNSAVAGKSAAEGRRVTRVETEGFLSNCFFGHNTSYRITMFMVDRGSGTVNLHRADIAMAGLEKLYNTSFSSAPADKAFTLKRFVETVLIDLRNNEVVGPFVAGNPFVKGVFEYSVKKRTAVCVEAIRTSSGIDELKSIALKDWRKPVQRAALERMLELDLSVEEMGKAAAELGAAVAKLDARLKDASAKGVKSKHRRDMIARCRALSSAQDALVKRMAAMLRA